MARRARRNLCRERGHNGNDVRTKSKRRHAVEPRDLGRIPAALLRRF